MSTAKRRHPRLWIVGGPYQPMPDLSPAQLATLRADIELNGIREPIVIDAETKQIVDGHHRALIASQLWGEWHRAGEKGPCPIKPDWYTLKRFESEQLKHDHAFFVNFSRRHLEEPYQRGLALDGWLASRGIKLGQGARNDTTGETLSDVAVRRLGRTVRTLHNWRKDAKTYEELPPDLQAEVRNGLKLSKAKSRAARAERDRQLAAAPVPHTDGDQRVFPGDFVKVGRQHVPDASAHLMVVDPPYLDEFMPPNPPLYEAIAREAERALVPGGILGIYAPKRRLFERLATVSKHLDYLYIVDQVLDQADPVKVGGITFTESSKPIVLFAKPGERPRPGWLIKDRVHNRPEKDWDDWQQPVGDAEHLINAFTEPGELVYDCCCGTGTALVAAKRLKRRWLGIDIKPEMVEKARARLIEEASTVH